MRRSDIGVVRPGRSLTASGGGLQPQPADPVGAVLLGRLLIANRLPSGPTSIAPGAKVYVLTLQAW